MLKDVRAKLGLAVLCFAGLFGCAHAVATKPIQVSASSMAFAKEALAVAKVTSEEDFLEARMVYQALPTGMEEHARLRGVLLSYLLGPIAHLQADALRKNPGLIGGEDDLERLHDSFRDALELFSPDELWSADGPKLQGAERKLLVDSAKLIVAVYSPRGNELPVAAALFALASLDRGNDDWSSRLQQLFSWLDSSAQLAASAQGPHRLTSPKKILEGIANI